MLNTNAAVEESAQEISMQANQVDNSLNLANQTDLDRAPLVEEDLDKNNEEPYFNSEVRRDIESEKIHDDEE